MEITDRADLGTALWAPQYDGVGRENWSYTLLTYVRPGDRVFHWHRSLVGEPAIVGWSEATGPLGTATKSWLAHGSAGRTRGEPSVGMAWVMPLAGLELFDEPIKRTEINAQYEEILSTLDLVAKIAGGPAYAPFQNYGGRELRAQQGYLTKFPAALVHLLSSKEASACSKVLVSPERSEARRSHAQGYLNDAEMRAALELHAVALARKMYEVEGATSVEEVGKPFDLCVTIRGVERHVEVKGSTGIELAAVQLTQGEVIHANNWGLTDLVVVDAIECWRDEERVLHTRGGRLRVWYDWRPHPADLVPTHHRYALPPGAQYR